MILHTREKYSNVMCMWALISPIFEVAHSNPRWTKRGTILHAWVHLGTHSTVGFQLDFSQKLVSTDMSFASLYNQWMLNFEKVQHMPSAWLILYYHYAGTTRNIAFSQNLISINHIKKQNYTHVLCPLPYEIYQLLCENLKKNLLTDRQIVLVWQFLVRLRLEPVNCFYFCALVKRRSHISIVSKKFICFFQQMYKLIHWYDFLFDSPGYVMWHFAHIFASSSYYLKLNFSSCWPL